MRVGFHGNPQESEDWGLLAKLVWRPAAGHKLGLGLEGREQETRTQALRRVGGASFNRIFEPRGDDETQRLRGSLDWEHRGKGIPYDRLSVKLYHQQSDTHTRHIEIRRQTSHTCAAGTTTPGPIDCRVERDFYFEQESSGLNVQLGKALATGALTHLLTVGADLGRVTTDQMTDATWTNLANGATSKTLAGLTSPRRDFPIGETDSIGLFVQDEISGLAGGRLTLTPALRYDWRELEPKVDALAQATLTAVGKQAVSRENDAISPKLSALWRVTPTLAAFGHIARGFRAPNYEEVNGNFFHPTQLQAIVPNPDLKPETSTGVELGLRATGDKLRGQVVVFDNRYKDFITRQRLHCPPPVNNPARHPQCSPLANATSMSVNLTRVNIKGWEARAAWDFLPGWKADGALAYARGDDRSSGRPLDSIEPLRYTLGLAREAGDWGAELRLRGAAKKDRVNDYEGTNYSPWFRPPAYTVGDVSAWWQFHKAARLTASIHNLTDEKYWLWSDIRKADARNPAGVDFYSQPGRTFSLALQAEF